MPRSIRVRVFHCVYVRVRHSVLGPCLNFFFFFYMFEEKRVLVEETDEPEVADWARLFV